MHSNPAASTDINWNKMLKEDLAQMAKKKLVGTELLPIPMQQVSEFSSRLNEAKRRL